MAQNQIIYNRSKEYPRPINRLNIHTHNVVKPCEDQPCIKQRKKKLKIPFHRQWATPWHMHLSCSSMWIHLKGSRSSLLPTPNNFQCKQGKKWALHSFVCAHIQFLHHKSMLFVICSNRTVLDDICKLFQLVHVPTVNVVKESQFPAVSHPG